MNKFIKSSLAAVAAAVWLLSSSCVILVEDGANIRYTWEGSQERYIVSIAASYRDVYYWYETVWRRYYPDVPSEASHRPKWDGSIDIPDNIYSSSIQSAAYKGVYYPIAAGKYTAVCTVNDFGDIYDIVANYEIEGYVYGIGVPTYYELAFDVRRFLRGSGGPNSWWFFDYYDNRNERPMLYKPSASPSPVGVFEENGATYIVFRRPD